jgi:DNA anti-recombination protein RmuC
MNKLSRGRGNLIRQAETFVELGVKVSKRLPKSILERADLSVDETAGDLDGGDAGLRAIEQGVDHRDGP